MVIRILHIFETWLVLIHSVLWCGWCGVCLFLTVFMKVACNHSVVSTVRGRFSGEMINDPCYRLPNAMETDEEEISHDHRRCCLWFVTLIGYGPHSTLFCHLFSHTSPDSFKKIFFTVAPPKLQSSVRWTVKKGPYYKYIFGILTEIV